MQVENKTAKNTIAVLKSLLVRCSIPNIIAADNLSSTAGRAGHLMFATQWNFRITTSRPQYPQSNGLVE